jgi:hypothetical protein
MTTRFRLSDRHQADLLLVPAAQLPLALLVLLLKAALGSSPGSLVGSCCTVATADHKVHRVSVNDKLMTKKLQAAAYTTSWKRTRRFCVWMGVYSWNPKASSSLTVVFLCRIPGYTNLTLYRNRLFEGRTCCIVSEVLHLIFSTRIRLTLAYTHILCYSRV